MLMTRSNGLYSLGCRLRRVVYSLTAGLFFSASIANAEIPSDFHVMSDRFDMEEEIDGAMSRYNYRYIQWLLEQDYPVPSIILHATARGMSISDVVYLLTRADPERAQLFYDHAQNMLPGLPGWVCQNRNGMDGRYYQRYTLEQLGGGKSIRKVAERFFKDGERLKPYPEWEKGKAHMHASINELIDLSREEAERARKELNKEDSWWYQSYRLPIDGKTPLFVSLYPNGKRIVIDADTGTLQALKQRGVAHVPVIFVFNGRNFIPTTHIDKAFDAEEQEEEQHNKDYIDYNNGIITASEVLDRYFSKGLKVTPPREWHQVDHHLDVEIKELRKLFEVPEAGDVEAGELQRMVQQIKGSGFKKPILITLNGSSGERWADDLKWITAAESMGMERVPTAFLYHELNRWPCDVPAACGDWICDAAVAGGASSSVCGPGKRNTRRSPFPPTRGPVTRPDAPTPPGSPN